MNHRILLTLVAVPTLAGSMLTMLLTAGLAQAAMSVALEQPSCSVPIEPGMGSLNTELGVQDEVIAAAAATEPAIDDSAMMDFTAAESDAAVILFGCDCPACIRSLRQLRSQSVSQILLSSNQGHCWDALLRRVSPQEAYDVLQGLEVEERTED